MLALPTVVSPAAKQHFLPCDPLGAISIHAYILDIVDHGVMNLLSADQLTNLQDEAWTWQVTDACVNNPGKVARTSVKIDMVQDA